MRDATGAVQRVLVLGGNSDIAWALLDALGPRLAHVDLAVRRPNEASERITQLEARGIAARALEYDADEADAHTRVLQQTGDVDLVVLAFGTLGDPYDLNADPAAAAELARTNFVAGVAAAHAAAQHLVGQGHGSLVVLSSVAGARVRAELAVYGAGKAGLDGFTQALADAVHGTGVHVMVVRPGFVHTKMTEGKPEAPFATTPERVAADIVKGLRRRKRVVWSPPVLGPAFAGLRLLPAPIWRRLGR